MIFSCFYVLSSIVCGMKQGCRTVTGSAVGKYGLWQGYKCLSHFRDLCGDWHRADWYMN
jgi:hypothetical protein